jgi:molecular chaperone GrpE (heat shock protein)
MAAMRREYEELEAAGRRATASAGAEQVEQLFKKLAPTLSNLAALTALAAAGRTVEAQDLLQVVRTVEKQMRAAGLETVGEVGATAEFDVALHQRMSGGMVTSGTAVSIRTPGYRFAGKVLLKAMVTAREQAE